VYYNLINLCSLGHTEGFYYKPRVDWELLERYNKGLIVLSACLSGEIPQRILQGDLQGARDTALRFRDIFGRDNFYLEVQNHSLTEEDQVNRELVRLAHTTGLPLVVGQDAHYLCREDAVAHDYVLCVQTGARLKDRNRMRLPNELFYLRSPDEMSRLFSDLPHALANTLTIAERCDFRFAFDRFHLPEYPLPSGVDNETYLRDLVSLGLRKRYNTVTPQIIERADEELSVICHMGFIGYFLIVWDFVRFARDEGIPVGPGRGSVTGSIVAYALGITEIDPLEYGLIFERFLNPARVTLPDIDIDFCFERRGEVISYVVGKYGEDRVAQIATFGTLGVRSAVRDLGRVMELSQGEIDRIARLIPFEHEQNVDRALHQSRELQGEVAKKPVIRELFNLARIVEGKPRNVSMHAAGVVITPEPLTSLLPLLRPRDEGLLTQYAMNDLELLGFLKIDFLGLRTLTLLEYAIKLISQQEGVSLDLRDIPLDDRQTYSMLCQGDTDGVFQLESDGMKRVLRQLQPNCIEDIIATNALYRPGPMEHIPEFIAAKRGKTKISYLHPKLEPILEGTYGVVVYQEQVMRIANEIAGFSMGEADLLRRGMSKRDPSQVQGLTDQFIAGAMAQGIDRDTAASIFELIKPFGSYGFNKSHSAAYGVLAYQTAWFKAHYPLYYFASLLSSFHGYQDQISKYVNYLKSKGYAFLQPDINLSHKEFSVYQGSIRFGFLAIKNLGINTVEQILLSREEGGSFSGLKDFVRRLGSEVNKRHIMALVRSGAFDSLGDRASHLLMIPELQDQVGSVSQKMKYGQTSLLSRQDEEIMELGVSETKKTTGSFTLRDLQNMEMEATGFVFTQNQDTSLGAPLRSFQAVKAGSSSDLVASHEIIGLTIRIVSNPGFQLDTLKDILKQYPGSIPVYLELTGIKRVQRVPQEFWVSPEESLLRQLRDIAGKKNVQVNTV